MYRRNHSLDSPFTLTRTVSMSLAGSMTSMPWDSSIVHTMRNRRICIDWFMSAPSICLTGPVNHFLALMNQKPKEYVTTMPTATME